MAYFCPMLVNPVVYDAVEHLCRSGDVIITGQLFQCIFTEFYGHQATGKSESDFYFFATGANIQDKFDSGVGMQGFCVTMNAGNFPIVQFVEVEYAVIGMAGFLVIEKDGEYSFLSVEHQHRVVLFLYKEAFRHGTWQLGQDFLKGLLAVAGGECDGVTLCGSQLSEIDNRTNDG